MDEAQIASLVVAGIKAGLAPLQAEVKALQIRCEGLMTAQSGLVALHERMAVVEAREAIPGPQGPQGAPGERGDIGPRGELGAPGERGETGLTGKDGTDGLGFDDLDETVEDDGRVIVRRYRQGERLKEFRHRVPGLLYRDVYVHGKAYEAGDVVTFGGSMWVAKQDTSEKPSDGATSWKMSVKHGREGKPGIAGKDGKDGRNGIDGKDLTGTGWARG